MKKIIRILFRYVLLGLVLIGVIFIIIKIAMSKIIPAPIQIIIIIVLTFISIIAGIELISSPTLKIKLQKNRLKRIRKKYKTKEFLEICNNLINKYIRSLEIYRKQATKCLKILVILLIIELILTITIVKFFEIDSKILIILFIIPSLILVWLFEKRKRKYNEEYRKNIIKELVKAINNNMNYDYDGNGEICDKYSEANFTDEEFNMFESTDYIYGKLENNIEMQLAKLSTLNCNQSGEIINKVDTFIFAYNKINFISPCKLRIRKNSIIKHINSVDMDDEEFEKYFDVYTSSHITAMQILTNDVMEEILYFYQKYGIDFEILIKEDNIYIKFNTGDVFKPSILKRVIDNDLLWIYYNILIFTISLCYRINKSLEGIEL